ncbi:MAG: hypothetical protein E7270_03100 [Lachnospiraceae bacterium]|nr:hypothetical protein [Lachnospiraceae bacterium]
MTKKSLFKRGLATVLSGSLALSLFVAPTPITANAATADITSNLVAHWKFDGNITETVGGIPTEYGARALTYAKGIHGQAAVFNGTDSYLIADACETLDLGSTYTANTDAFTISMWLNMGDCKDTTKYLLQKGGDDGWKGDYYYSTPYELYLNGAAPSVELSNEYQDSSSEYSTSGHNYLSDKYADGSEWFLYTLTYDGSRIKIYHNNELINQLNYTDGITKNDMDLYIGTNFDLDDYYKGMMDDLRMYTRTLSYDDVEALYNAGVAANKEALNPTKQLVAYYKFDGNLNDSTAFANHGEEVSATGTINYGWGKSGQALTMGNGKYFEIPYAEQLNFGKEYTISFWVKQSLEGNRPILYRQNPAYGQNDNDNYYTYAIYADSWSEGECFSSFAKQYLFDYSSWCPGESSEISTNTLSTDSNGILASDWKHIAYTFNNGELKCYFNGTLLTTEEATEFTKIVNSAGSLLIGYDGDTFFQGSLDELKIYNRCLNISEIRTEYNRINAITIDSATITKLSKMKKGSSVTIANIGFKNVNTGAVSNIASSNSSVSFRTSNSAVATVTNNGVVKAVGNGTATITAVCNGISKDIKITVKSDTVSITSAQVKSISTVKKGKSVTINSIKVKDGFTGATSTIKSSNSKVTFKSSNPKIFKVTNSGKITGVKNGSAKLTITYGAFSRVYNVNVKSDTISVTSAVSKKLKAIKVKKSYTIPSIKVKDAITSKTSTIKSSNNKVTFTSSNKKIFTVTAKGKITGKKAGSATLTIKYNGFSKSITVKIVK